MFKIEMGFEWVVRYCSFKFLFKVDDDVFINFLVVIVVLNRVVILKDKFYMGYVYRNFWV